MILIWATLAFICLKLIGYIHSWWIAFLPLGILFLINLVDSVLEEFSYEYKARKWLRRNGH